MTEAVVHMCPGAKSPFSVRTFGRCIDEFDRFHCTAKDMGQAMRWSGNTMARLFPTMLP